MPLSYFSTKSWVFSYDKRLWLCTQLNHFDSKHFQLDGMETLITYPILEMAYGEKDCIF